MVEVSEEEEEEEEEGGGVVESLNNLDIETVGTEEEATEGLKAALGMAAREMEVEKDRGSKEEDEGGGTQREMGALEFLTQDAELSGTRLVDARNRFNKLSGLAMLWTVRHRWPAGARFAFNYYRHWAQLLLRQPGDPPVTILSRSGVTQGDPLSTVLYGITLVPLSE